MGRITLKWLDAPTDILGPYARTTGTYVYQILDAEGRKLIGGTSGPCLEQTKAWVIKRAADKGLINPTIEVA